MCPRHMIERMFDTLAALGIVKHYLSGTDSSEDVSLPKYTRSLPMLGGADSVTLHQSFGFIRSKLGLEEDEKIVEMIAAQSL